MPDTDVLNRMALEIMAGMEWGDPNSQVPQTSDYRRSWERMAEQIADMRARGIEVEVPFEVPDVNEP